MVDSARSGGSPSRLAHALYMRSVAETSVGRTVRGAVLAGEAHAAARASASPTSLAQAHYALGLALEGTEPLESGRLLREAARIAASAGNRWVEAFALTEVWWLEARLGDIAAALAGFGPVIETWHCGGDWANLWLSLRHVFGILQQTGDHRAAAVLHGALVAAGANDAMPFEPRDAEHLADIVEQVRAQLGPETFDQAATDGATTPEPELVAYILQRITDLMSNDQRLETAATVRVERPEADRRGVPADGDRRRLSPTCGGTGPRRGARVRPRPRYDHVLGADPEAHAPWRGPYDVHTTFHEPFVLFGYLAACTGLELVTGVIILPQRQTALVAKQAAEDDLLTDGRFRLGVGLGWNASTTRTTRRSSARGPAEQTLTPASTRPSMNAACSTQPGRRPGAAAAAASDSDLGRRPVGAGLSARRPAHRPRRVPLRAAPSFQDEEGRHAVVLQRWGRSDAGSRDQSVCSSASERPAASRPSINATVAPLSGRSSGGGSGIGSARAVGICSTSRRATPSETGSPVT